MPPYHATRGEQETLLRWDRDDPTVHVWTADPVTWRKLERLGIPATRETRREGAVSGRFYLIPLSRFRWGLKRVGTTGQNLPRRVREPRLAGSSGPSEARAGVGGRV
jgi:hypothetical protein